MNCALVIDNHPIVLQGCRQILEEMSIESIIEAITSESGFIAYQVHKPSLAIIDLCLDRVKLTGLDLIAKIRSLDAEMVIVAFSMHDDPTIRLQSLRAGATAFVPKDASIECLVAACTLSQNERASNVIG